jgi:hypothetical protein
VVELGYVDGGVEDGHIEDDGDGVVDGRLLEFVGKVGLAVVVIYTVVLDGADDVDGAWLVVEGA